MFGAEQTGGISVTKICKLTQTYPCICTLCSHVIVEYYSLTRDNMHFFYLASLISALSCSCQVLTNSSYLTATALVTNQANHSALECWEFDSPFTISAAAGTSGAATYKFNASSAEYTVIPPRFNGGTHNAPAPQ